MEQLPVEVCFRIFELLDHQSLASANQVSKKWRTLASDNSLWCNLFKQRWGQDSAASKEPKIWKNVYTVQHRCDRYGLGRKIIREGIDYYTINQGEITSYLGSPSKSSNGDEQQSAISDRLIFFLGDLEAACANAKIAKMDGKIIKEGVHYYVVNQCKIIWYIVSVKPKAIMGRKQLRDSRHFLIGSWGLRSCSL